MKKPNVGSNFGVGKMDTHVLAHHVDKLIIGMDNPFKWSNPYKNDCPLSAEFDAPSVQTDWLLETFPGQLYAVSRVHGYITIYIPDHGFDGGIPLEKHLEELWKSN